MTISPVQLDYDEFFRAFLSPLHVNFRAKRVTPHAFSRLNGANEWPENTILQHFVGLSQLCTIVILAY